MDPIAPHCLILSHPQPRDTGDYRHRVTLPGRALARHCAVSELQTTHPEFVQRSLAADLLIAVMIADPIIETIFAARKARGLPNVYEISDDFHDFPASQHNHDFYARPDTQALIETLARQADLLQFSSHGLQAKYGSLNLRNAVFVNQIDAVAPLRPPRARDSTVLGWAGSLGHLDDARRLASLLRAWRRRRPTHGLMPELHLMTADAVAQAFADSGLTLRTRATGSFDDYLRFLDGINVGFAILGESDFARGRSDGKFIEYASRGVLCLASHAGEYAHSIEDDETGLFFQDEDSFVAALDRAVDDAEDRERMVRNAHAYVSRKRSHAIGAEHRAKTYRALLDEICARGFAWTNDTERSLQCLSDRTETALLEATMLHGAGRLNEALTKYIGVLNQWPEFYLPWDRGALIADALGARQDAASFRAAARQSLARSLQA